MKTFSKILIMLPFLCAAMLAFTVPVCGQAVTSGAPGEGAGDDGSGGTRLQLAIRYSPVGPFDAPRELRQREGTGAGFHDLVTTDTIKPLGRGQAAFSDTKLLR